MWKVAFWFLQFPTEHDALHAGGHQLVACPLAEGTLPTCPLDSISTNFLASSELAKELVRVSRVSRPSAQEPPGGVRGP